MNEEIDRFEGPGIERPALILDGKTEQAQWSSQKARKPGKNIVSKSIVPHLREAHQVLIVIEEKAAIQRRIIKYPDAGQDR